MQITNNFRATLQMLLYNLDCRDVAELNQATDKVIKLLKSFPENDMTMEIACELGGGSGLDSILTELLSPIGKDMKIGEDVWVHDDRFNKNYEVKIYCLKVMDIRYDVDNGKITKIINLEEDKTLNWDEYLKNT